MTIGQIRLSGTYDARYGRLLEHLARSPSLHESKLAAFWPVCGTRYAGLMVIGRATNGEVPGWTVDLLRDPSFRQTVIEQARRQSQLGRLQGAAEGDDPFRHFLDDYPNANRSRVGQLTKALVAHLFAPSIPPALDARSWHCWSNLYKVAPMAGGNPSEALMKAQLPFAVDLLAEEIRMFDPRWVVVFSGGDWFAPFADRLGLTVDWVGSGSGTALHGIVRDHDRRWAILFHPSRKRGLTNAEILSDILAAFR